MMRLALSAILGVALAAGGAGIVIHQKAQRELPASVAQLVPHKTETTVPDKDEIIRRKLDAGGEVIDKVWSGSPVRFAIVTSKEHIFVGYYDQDRRLTVAQRDIHGGAWTYVKLDTITTWDSHKTVNMAIDNSGRLHIAANMHGSPLTYYMSDPSGDASTLKRIKVLVDRRVEQSMTYPSYMRDRKNRLILRYRDGASGDGNEIYDVFDDGSGTWSHLTPTPIVDGEGKRNAYFMGPQRGPDGYFHMAWVWRDTPDVSTNHDMTYARSRDLVHWERADGTPLQLPIRLGAGNVIDSAGIKTGLMNGAMGFDAQNRLLIAYHKYDANGDSQIYLARLDGKEWHVIQASRWQGYRWNFSGGGSIDFAVYPGKPFQSGDEIVIPVTRDNKNTVLHLNASDLEWIDEKPEAAAADPVIAGISVPPGMILNQAVSRQDDKDYMIGWASNPPNRDQPREKTPAASPLILFKVPARSDG